MTAAMLGTPKPLFDWNRSFALGVALAINLAALGALAVMQPSWQPTAVPTTERRVIELVWPEILPVLPEVPLAPPRNSAAIPVPVRVEPVDVVVAPTEDSVPVAVDPVQAVDNVAVTTIDTHAGGLGVEGGGEALVDRDAGVALADPSSPPYPIVSLRKRAEGTVLLEIMVDANGAALDVRVIRSSGHRELDRSAREHVLREWTFQPAIREGKPVRARVRVPIEFTLDSR